MVRRRSYIGYASVIHGGSSRTVKRLYVPVVIRTSVRTMLSLCDAGFLKMFFKHSVSEQGSERARNKSYYHNECNMRHGKYM